MSPMTRGKQTKEEVGYVDIATNPSEQCAGCKHFKPYKGRRDRNGCARVMGDINEHGWCKLFAPGSSGRKPKPLESEKTDDDK